MNWLRLILPLAVLTAVFGLMMVSSGRTHDALFGYGTASLALLGAILAFSGPPSWRPFIVGALLIPWIYFILVAR